MPDALDRWFAVTREWLIEAVLAVGPWALPGLAVLAVLAAVALRDRLVSPGGLIVLLAIATFFVVVRAIQLGRF